MPTLFAEGVTAGYGRVPIINDITLAADIGSVTTIVGPNGAGKSTFAKTLVGILKPMSGRITVNDFDITTIPGHQIPRRGLVYVPQNDNVFKRLTVRENLEVGGFASKGDTSARMQEVLGIFADHLTGGDLYRVEIYFVGTREYPDLKFGGRIDNVQDPVTGLVVSLGVYGEYSLKVVVPPTLLTNLTGTVDVTDNGAITDWVAQQLLKVLRTDVTQHVVSKGWPILGLAAYVPEVEADVITLSAQQVSAYGLSVARMGNFTISLGDEDEAQLKTLARDTAYSRLAGSFQQYAAGELQLGAGQGMAQGGQAVGGAFLGAGLGLGGQATQMPGVGPTPPSARAAW